MCGIAGFLLAPDARVSLPGDDVLRRMGDALAHRGPDDQGRWLSDDGTVGLAHRRLSIVDLSAAGHQPMTSHGGRFEMVFNGEIYNHLELREQLGGAAPAWRGHADTETLLAGFEAWGIDETITRSVGMFALAVWDRERRELVLARDRLGEKPLYYGWQRGVFLFGSELKALRAHPAFAAGIDRGALASFLRLAYVPAPHCIHEGLAKLPPGTIARVTGDGRDPRPVAYWDARAVIAAGLADPFDGTPDDAVDALDVLLRRAVRGQMMSDVPLGAFLSGGIDSSVIVALMQAQSAQPVRTFTIGFQEGAYTEAHHARAVAKHLGTDHTELEATPAQALDIIPRLPAMYDEPFADVSQLPTYLVAHLTRRHVTVSLSGDAGDELFGGYSRYRIGRSLWGRLARVPLPVRAAAAAGIRSVSPQAWNRLPAAVRRRLPGEVAQGNTGDRVHKAADALTARSTEDLYRCLVGHWQDPATVVIEGAEPRTILGDRSLQPQADDFVHRMMAVDLVTYLPDDILVKVDRAAMATSLETRVPMLDHRVVEFAWTLPLDYKLRGGVGKWPLRQVLHRYVPQDLVERPKMGFGVPIDSWLRGPLKDWAEDLLDASRLRQEGFLQPAPIRRKWAEHLSGRRNWQYQLWNVLMFQEWLRANGSGGAR